MIGTKTLVAAQAADPQVLKARLLAQRLRFMGGLGNWLDACGSAYISPRDQCLKKVFEHVFRICKK